MSQDESRPPRLLVVEDNLGDARLLQEELKDVPGTHFDVRHVTHMAGALAAAGASEVDVMLLDLSLPDGFGLSNIERVLQVAPGVPIVVLTGTDDEQLAMRAMHAGAQDYLVKGQVTGALLVRALRYAIERRRAEEGLKREAAAQQTALFREQFLGVLGHDLRNPLQAISGNAALLLRYSGLSEPQRKAAHRIANASDRMGKLINDILDFTRTRLGGGYPLQRTWMNVHEVLRQVVEELEVAHPQRRFELELSGDGWGEWDAGRIAQAVSNLVGNAVQYSPEDSVVRVRAEDGSEGPRVEVHNRGVPIPAERLPHIFAPFERAESSRARSGLGLGLYITHEIIKAHGGVLVVRSNEAEGTCFAWTLPRKPPTSPAA